MEKKQEFSLKKTIKSNLFLIKNFVWEKREIIATALLSIAGFISASARIALMSSATLISVIFEFTPAMISAAIWLFSLLMYGVAAPFLRRKKKLRRKMIMISLILLVGSSISLYCQYYINKDNVNVEKGISTKKKLDEKFKKSNWF